jgi:transposase
MSLEDAQSAPAARQAGQAARPRSAVISGILHALKTACRWRDVPPVYGPPTTIYNRYNRWSVAHRIADPRVLHLIERWLGAGALESGHWKAAEAGTPQRSGISPILANVFLHYVVDLWVHQRRRRRAVEEVIVCRYADNMVIGCQFEADGKNSSRTSRTGWTVRPVAPRGQDPVDRVRRSAARTKLPLGGDARRLSTFWASLLRQDQDEQVHGQAEDSSQASGPKAEGNPRRDATSDARSRAGGA